MEYVWKFIKIKMLYIFTKKHYHIWWLTHIIIRKLGRVELWLLYQSTRFFTKLKISSAPSDISMKFIADIDILYKEILIKHFKIGSKLYWDEDYMEINQSECGIFLIIDYW